MVQQDGPAIFVMNTILLQVGGGEYIRQVVSGSARCSCYIFVMNTILLQVGGGE